MLLLNGGIVDDGVNEMEVFVGLGVLIGGFLNGLVVLCLGC